MRFSSTSPSRRTVTSAAAGLGALILDAEADGLRLPDNAEARRLREYDAPVDFVLMARDQRVQRRRKTQRGGIGRHVVNAAVGDQDGAGDAVGRHVGERRRQCRKQLGAVGFAVGGAGFSDTHFKARNALEPFDECCARGLGLLGAVAEILARAFVDDDGCDRRDRVAILAGQRRVGEREHHQGQGESTQRRATAARDEQEQSRSLQRRQIRPTPRRRAPKEQMRCRGSRSSSYCPSRSSSAGICTWSAL